MNTLRRSHAHFFAQLALIWRSRTPSANPKTWTSISLIVSVIIALPILSVLFALTGPTTTAWTHIRETILLSYLSNTLWLMIQVGIYTLVLGVATAWLTAATDFTGRKLLTWALILPLAAPAYIVAYVYTDLLEFSGPVQSALRNTFGLNPGDYFFPQIRSLPGAALIISLVLYPYVYLLTRVAFTKRSVTLFDAARTLGASPTRAFFRIALPAARPAIAGGLALVLMETLADFGVVDYFGVPTFSTGIFRTWFAMGEQAAAMKLAAVMLVFVILLIALEKSQSPKGGPSALAKDGSFNRIPLKGWQAALALFICLVPVLLGCVIPLLILFQYAIQSGDPLFGRVFLSYMSNSVWVSSAAALITVGVALLLTYAQHLSANRLTSGSIKLATLGYALPGTMLAVGLLAPISQLDRWLANYFETQWDWQAGLLLTGTATILIYAYVVRFLTVAFNSTSSGMTQIPQAYEQAARSLGASPRKVIRRIHFPLMRRAVWAALLLVFVDTMRELPATLLLRPFNFETLATRVYRLASDERLADASTAAIAIVLIGLIPVLFLNRLK